MIFMEMVFQALRRLDIDVTGYECGSSWLQALIKAF